MNRDHRHLLLTFLLGWLCFCLLSCEGPKQTKKVEPYSGPIEEINDVRLLYSEAAVMKVKLTTARQLRYANDNRKYPRPVNIIFYDQNGQEETKLQSDSGKYDKAKDLYTVMGHVVVTKLLNQQKMLTDQLNWSPVTKKIYTDLPVTILSPETGERLQGIGLDAPQDFSRYSIRKTTGIFNISSTP
ncbi:LPS export ABC transporter periplasmic protein LptC [Spirosoma sp. KUDC1026]|uniref:LPS export ABC transporter periplasmic protein LptC n=1 Tax=Spirosoma sp. KUDC1026 TaxID=2745947 RepID=UPI00159BBD8E|nr:LPS export ABC transporter periplasmic protein LptC [Spirosoma sp. KUDC1026]QKZ14358.1 LPS export ABC transporter periplasmic protein LptC [Spirosoma sp. KUDC1026]